MPLNPSNTNQSYLSTDNSSFMPLIANGQFTGKWEDVSSYPLISTICKTDQTGTLYYQYSIDGIQIDRSFTIAIIDVTDGNYTSSGPRARYFRIKYINGPTKQNTFRLQTIYSPFVSDAAHSAVQSGVSPRSNSSVCRSVMFGITPNNTYVPLKIGLDGTLSSNSAQNPLLKTNKLTVTTDSSDQIILTYTPPTPFSLHGLSVFVWSTIQSAMVIFGECSLESGNTKLYTAQMTSMNNGQHAFTFATPLIFPANQAIKLVCSPFPPINTQYWQGNLIGSL
jgi:hypothetical protein